jgi:hypothetical protein
MAGASMIPMFEINTTPLNNAYAEENNFPCVDFISITGPIPLKIIEAL